MDEPRRPRPSWLVVMCIILSMALVPTILSRVLWDTSLMPVLSAASPHQA